jgi:hypothetical protein
MLRVEEHLNLDRLNDDCLRVIAEYLPHIGPLREISTNFSRVFEDARYDCCPHQMHYHPVDEDFDESDDNYQVVSSDDDNDSSCSLMGLNASQFADKVFKWPCCKMKSNRYGCISTAEMSDESREEAITRQKEFYDNCVDNFVARRNWDESMGDNANRLCTCGYADGIYDYCECGLPSEGDSDEEGCY